MNEFDILLKNGRIWNGKEFLPNADAIAVKDGKIVAIGRQLHGATTVFDLNQAIISPGFIDIHTHMRGITSDSFGIPAEAACFPFGVTTAIEASACQREGGAILRNMCLNTFVFVASAFKNGELLKEELVQLLESYGEKVLGIKLFFDTSSPEIKDISPLIEVLGFARERNLKVLIHSTGSPVPMGELLDILQGGDICTHIFHGGKNNVTDDAFSSMKKAKARGVILDAGMAGGVHTDLAILKDAITAQMLPDTISTDITKLSAFRRGGNYGLTLCMSVMRTLGMTEEQILRAVTLSPAKAIDKEAEVGTLHIGGRADIAVLDYTEGPFHIRDTYGNAVGGEKGYTCLLTVCGGQLVYRANDSRMIQEDRTAR